MKRRNLLRSAALLSLLSGGFAALLAPSKAANAVATRATRRVRPADPSWPATASWAKLNDAVGGNLSQVHSLFASCGTDPNGADCLDAHKNLRNPFWIGDQPAGTEVSGWLDAWSPAPSAYAVKARHAADVASAVVFARKNNLRLVVKGGGHSYLGTSNAPDSLLIWTRAMNKVTLHDAFVSKGCEARTAPVPAVSAESGAVWMDLYNAVTTEGARYVQGGGCTTVGVAGLVQSGGFGSFSKGFGTAAAGLLEAEIVTADGQVRIVNACTDPDLFWAIKGGGGGTFGVVTRLTLRTHDLPSFFGFAAGKIKAQSDAAFARLIERFIGFYHKNLFNPHWGEQVKFGPDNTFEISMVSQGLDNGQAGGVWQPFFDWVAAAAQDFAVVSPLRCGVRESRGWWNVNGRPALIRDARDGAPQYHGWWQGDQDQVGAFLHGFDSLWLPASLLEEDRQAHLAGALFAASRYRLVELHINKGLAGAPPEALAATRLTATNPAVLDAFSLAIIADGERPAYAGLARPAMDLDAAHKNARDIDRAAAELRKIVPHAGSYVSESNYFNRSWQNAYWGENYSRLRAVKTQYDPEGLFFVHHGVGSEDWSADGFTRLTRS
jgi:FAD/FMN-containing dehydrogenase